MQWWGIHRHDIPVDSEKWKMFDGVLHNGTYRFSRISLNFPHLYGICYVYPYAVFDKRTGTALSFFMSGNLFEQYINPPLLTNKTFYPTTDRKGVFVNWDSVDDEFLMKFAYTKLRSLNIKYVFIDNIPELFRIGSDSNPEKFSRYCKKLVGIFQTLGYKVFGNLWEGSPALNPFAEVAEGIFLEQWIYSIYGKKLNNEKIKAIEKRIKYYLDNKKLVCLNLPYIKKEDLDFAISKVKEYSESSFFGEMRSNPLRVSVLEALRG